MRTGLDRGSANELLGKLNTRLEGMVAEPTLHINECYDLVNHRPLPDYERKYLQIKEELARLGLNFV
jgi:hypothetical protein